MQAATARPLYNTGVIHGRFQILHHDHVKYLLAGKALCRHLVVGITNPDPMRSRAETADPERNLPLANPLTYFERYSLIKTVFETQGLKPDQYSVVPFPINFPELYHYYVPMDAVFFLTIYDEWGKKKLEYFQELGLQAHVLREVGPEKKGISAKDIRECMRDMKPWEHWVPPCAARLLKQWGVPEKVKREKSAGTEDLELHAE